MAITLEVAQMLKRFVDWLDSYLEREGPSGLVKAIAGILSFSLVLGTIVGVAQGVRTGVTLAIILAILSVGILLVEDRKKLRHKYDLHKRLLQLYCDFILDHQEDPIILIREWKQNTFVKENGDVREVLKIKAVAARDHVYFLRFRAGCAWNQPEKDRKGVAVIARRLSVNDDAPWTRWHVTRTWIGAGRLNSIVHFHSPIRRDEEFSLEVERVWPGKCVPLMKRRDPDSFTFGFNKLMPVQSIEYHLVLPAGFEAFQEPIGFVQPDQSMSLEVETDAERRKVYTFRAQEVPEDRRVGMRLEIRK